MHETLELKIFELFRQVVHKFKLYVIVFIIFNKEVQGEHIYVQIPRYFELSKFELSKTVNEKYDCWKMITLVSYNSVNKQNWFYEID